MGAAPIPSSPRRRGPRFWWDKCCNRINALVQINPMQVHFFNNSEFPSAVPLFDLLLALYGILHKMMVLVPYQRFQSICLGEAFEPAVLVVPDTIPERTRDANVHRAAIKVRHYINGWPFFFPHHLTQSCRFTSVNKSGAPAFAGVTELFEGASE